MRSCAVQRASTLHLGHRGFKTHESSLAKLWGRHEGQRERKERYRYKNGPRVLRRRSVVAKGDAVDGEAGLQLFNHVSEGVGRTGQSAHARVR